MNQQAKITSISAKLKDGVHSNWSSNGRTFYDFDVTLSNGVTGVASSTGTTHWATPGMDVVFTSTTNDYGTKIRLDKKASQELAKGGQPQQQYQQQAPQSYGAPMPTTPPNTDMAPNQNFGSNPNSSQITSQNKPASKDRSVVLAYAKDVMVAHVAMGQPFAEAQMFELADRMLNYIQR